MDIRGHMASVLADEAVFEELREANFLDRVLYDRNVESVEGPAGSSAESMVAATNPSDIAAAAERVRRGDFNPDDMIPAEAIIVRFGFPSLLVQRGTFVEPALKVWQQRLSASRAAIDKAIAATGRIELRGLPGVEWLGTGWLIDEVTIVTNRHVASHFAGRDGSSVRLRSGISVSIDYREEHAVEGEHVSAVTDVLHIEDRASGVDLAFLRLADGDHGLAPIALGELPSPSDHIGVIGYPAFDPRNSPSDQARIFDGIYEKKRFAPGNVMTETLHGGLAFAHNCTTLGGNSGSVVINIATGEAVGLHYGGREGDRNEAVRPDILRERATRHRVSFRTGAAPAGGGGYGGGGKDGCANGWGGGEGPPRTPTHYQGRSGFDPDFLGGSLRVPLPQLNALQIRDAARLGDGTFELKYEHFSVVMNAARRLAFYTAVNIDGSDLWHKPRGRDQWKTDPRVPDDAQVDNALYKHNDFDRGHLVRRLDPVWGDKTAATRAEDDTFHYTNAAPQHKDLNQRVWLGLEEHILNRAAANRDARISVLCGPIFGYADPLSKRPGLEAVGIPLGFWKVVGSIGRKARGRNATRTLLQAQAFVIWQHEMFGPRDLELVFGHGFETYQVPVAGLERLCGLDFGPLRDADTLGELPGEAGGEEGVAAGVGAAAVSIRDGADIV